MRWSILQIKNRERGRERDRDMQNVSRIQKHPDTLITNFFIAGISQETLKDSVFPEKSKERKSLFDLKPELLFSLFEDNERMQAYLGQVFPENVRILQTEKIVDPKFFTFMSTDMSGFNCYQHVLIFYERFTEQLIREDFDELALAERNLKEFRRRQQINQMRDRRGARSSSQAGDKEGADSTGFGNSYMAGVANRRQRMVPTRIDHHVREEEQKETSMSIDVIHQRFFNNRARGDMGGRLGSRSTVSLSTYSKREAPTDQQPTLNQVKSVALPSLANQSSIAQSASAVSASTAAAPSKQYLSTGTSNNARTASPAQKRASLAQNFLTTVAEEREEAEASSVMYNTADHGADDDDEPLYGEIGGRERSTSSAFYKKRDYIPDHKNPHVLHRAESEGTALLGKAFDNLPTTSKKQNRAVSADVGKLTVIAASKGDKLEPYGDIPTPCDDQARCKTTTSALERKQIIDEPQTYQSYFAPIAFVIKTDVEHHDIFKHILLQLFESIRLPEEVTGGEYSDRYLAFADLLSHITFLASIPAPSFNTRFHLEIFDKNLTIQEPNYDQIPDKNQFAIRVLFEMLDVRSILYCWKALLFDLRLVLISQQYSNQFYVAQALLQLLFPLTYQSTYIQPGSSSKLNIVDVSPLPAIFCCQQTVADFDTFEQLENKAIAICDIDGSFTNNLDMPSLEDERSMIRTLNMLKNRRGYRSDGAFPELYQKDLKEADKHFTTEVRNVFKSQLDQFLIELPSYFKEIQADEELTFINYFDEEKYLDEYEGFGNYDFARYLVNSQCFASFCDDYFENYVSNVLIYTNISGIGIGMDEIDQKDKEVNRKFQLKMKQLAEDLAADKLAHPRPNLVMLGEDLCPVRSSQPQFQPWPRHQTIDFCWRMPQDNQRVMLFEKLEYAVKYFDRMFKQSQEAETDPTEAEKLRELNRNHEIQMHKFACLIAEIKRLYQSKLPSYKQQVMRASKELDKTLDVCDNASAESGDSLLVKGKGAVRRMQTQVNRADLKSTPTIAEEDEDESENSAPVNDAKIQSRLKHASSGPVDLSASTAPKTTEDADNGHFFSQNFGKDTGLDDKEAGNEAGKAEADAVAEGGSGFTAATIEFKKEQRKQQSFTQSNVKPDYDKSPKQIIKKKVNFADDQPQQRMAQTASAGQPSLAASTEVNDFRQQQKQEREKYNHYRIVDLCYGTKGLIEFLNTLFTQMPSKKAVQKKFNFFFAMQRQLKAIEQQIEDIVSNVVSPMPPSDRSDSQEFDGMRHRASSDDSGKFSFGGGKRPILHKQTLSLVEGVQALAAAEEMKDRQASQETTKDLRLWQRKWDLQEYNPTKIKEGKITVFDQVGSNVWMLPVLPEEVETEPDSGVFLNQIDKLMAFRSSYQYISLKEKLYFAFESKSEAIQLIFNEFLRFKHQDRQIFPRQRFCELLEHMTADQKERIFKTVQRGLDKDQEIFQLRLMFNHSQQEEGVTSQNVSLDQSLFDKDYIALTEAKNRPKPAAVSAVIEDKALLGGKPSEVEFQRPSKGKMSFGSHFSISGSCSPSAVKRKNKKRQSDDLKVQELKNLALRISKDKKSSTKLSKELNTSKTIEKKISSNINASLSHAGSVTSPSGSAPGSTPVNAFRLGESVSGSVRNADFFTLQTEPRDSNDFNSIFFDTSLLPAPEKIQKLLYKLIKAFAGAFEPDVFDMQSQRIKKEHRQKYMDILKEHRAKLDSYSHRKLFFGAVHNYGEEGTELCNREKHCFWMNLHNMIILMKIFELMLCKPDALKALETFTMFLLLQKSCKVTIQGEQINAMEIYRVMLCNGDTGVMRGPFGEPCRTVEEMPESLRSLQVDRPISLSSFGLFYPNKKLPQLTVFDKIQFDDQLKNLVHLNLQLMLQIQPDNFLVRIPMLFRWCSGSGYRNTLRRLKHPDDDVNDLVCLLRSISEEEYYQIDPEMEFNLKATLDQIDQESKDGQPTSHFFEFDKFNTMFVDIPYLRENLLRLASESNIRDSTVAGTVVETTVDDLDEEVRST